LTGDIWTSAEADYTAKGLQQTVQGTVISTREPKVQRDALSEDKEIIRQNVTSSSVTIEQNQGGGGRNDGQDDNDDWPPPPGEEDENDSGGGRTSPGNPHGDHVYSGGQGGFVPWKSGCPHDPVGQSFYVDVTNTPLGTST
jgi:hypothetical protein